MKQELIVLAAFGLVFWWLSRSAASTSSAGLGVNYYAASGGGYM